MIKKINSYTYQNGCKKYIFAQISYNFFSNGMGATKLPKNWKYLDRKYIFYMLLNKKNVYGKDLFLYQILRYIQKMHIFSKNMTY